jgi:hypothetical protein
MTVIVCAALALSRLAIYQPSILGSTALDALTFVQETLGDNIPAYLLHPLADAIEVLAKE